MGSRTAARSMALLIYLRLARPGEYVSRNELLRKLWRPPRTNLDDVRNAVFRIRKSLGDPILEDGPNDSLRVLPSALPTDADLLRAALDDAGPPDDPVIRAYKPFLEGWPRPVQSAEQPILAHSFVSWIEQTREQLASRVLTKLETNAQWALQTGAWAELDEIATRVFQLFGPTARPHAWVWRLQAAQALGRRADGESVHIAFRRALAEAPSLEAVGEEMDRLRAALRPTSVGTSERARGEQTPAPAAWRAWKPSRLVPARPTALATAGALLTIALGVGGLAVATTMFHRRAPAENAGGDLATHLCAPGAEQISLLRHNYQLGAVVRPGGRFTKGWVLQNDGNCTWGPGMRLHFLASSDSALSASHADTTLQDSIRPGQHLLLTMGMRAPSSEGTAWERWVLLDAEGRGVNINGAGDTLEARIRVLRHTSPCSPGAASALLVTQSHVPNQPLATGADFTASWSLKNDGSCVWPATVHLERTGHATLGDTISRVIGDSPVPPGAVATFRVAMRVPETPGVWSETWTLVDSGATGRHPVSGAESLPIRVLAVAAGNMANQPVPPACQRHQAVAGWVSETPLDSASIQADAIFQKVWTFSNPGPCAWSDVELSLRSASGTRLSAVDHIHLSGVVYPGASYNFDVPMRAPHRAGVYRETWVVRDAFGDPLRVGATDSVWVIIRVPPRW